MKILVISHNDPRFHPGGTEIFAHALFREFDRRPDLQAWFVAGVNHLHRQRRPGTAFQRAPGAGPREFLLWCGHYDVLCHSQVDGLGVFPEFEELLENLQPDVVHFHHFMLLGLEAFYVVRRVLPRAKIVLTLHDYHLLCANEGLLRTSDGRLCRLPSPDACAACRSDLTPLSIALKERYARMFLTCVDAFASPSRFLRDVLVRWGIDPDRITVLRNGHDLTPSVAPRVLAEGGKRSSFALFGNQNPHKGTLVALDAALRLVAQGRDDFTLHLHGAPLFQDEDFQNQLTERLDRLRRVAIVHGRYAAEDLPRRMASADWVIVPSVWYENSPLTIQEAFHHGRPVICSDVGGMAEAVDNGRSGLHFPVGDFLSLADTMIRAMDTPGLWDTLRAGCPAAMSIAACADEHLAWYGTLKSDQNHVAAGDCA